MSQIRLRHVVQVNPGSPRFDRLSVDAELTFLPMEAVWADTRLDASRVRPKSAVAVGYTRFQDGDVLLPKITPTFEAGRSILVAGLCNGVGAGTTELHILRAGPSINPRFLTYVTQSHRFLKLGEAEMYGVAGQKRVPDDFVRDFLIDLPTLEQQGRICAFLDGELAQQRRLVSSYVSLLRLLDERTQTCLADCVAGVAVPGRRKIDSILGSVPESWPIVAIRRVVPRVGVGVVVNPSSYFVDDGVPFLRGANVQEGWIDLVDVKRMSSRNSELLWRSRLDAGDVVVVRAGDPGRAAVVPQELEGGNCASIIILKSGGSLVPGYLEAFFNSPLGRGQVQSVRYGAAQEQINVGHVVDFKVPVPSVSIQRELLDILIKETATINTLRASIQGQLSALESRKSVLIEEAVTGQIDVTTARGVG